MPAITDKHFQDEDAYDNSEITEVKARLIRRRGHLKEAIKSLGGSGRTGEIAERMGITPGGAYKQLTRAAARGQVERIGKGRWIIP